VICFLGREPFEDIYNLTLNRVMTIDILVRSSHDSSDEEVSL